MSRSSAAAASVLAAELESVNWRIERLTSLMGEDWLAGEWDREAQLILPEPGGRLHGIRRCIVAGCPRDGHWNHSLCVHHRGPVRVVRQRRPRGLGGQRRA